LGGKKGSVSPETREDKTKGGRCGYTTEGAGCQRERKAPGTIEGKKGSLSLESEDIKEDYRGLGQVQGRTPFRKKIIAREECLEEETIVVYPLLSRRLSRPGAREPYLGDE